MLRFERCFFGRLESTMKNADGDLCEDRMMPYLLRAGLILVFSLSPERFGQKIIFFFPSSFYSPEQRYFRTAPGVLEMSNDTAVFEAPACRYRFMIGSFGLTRENKYDLMTMSHLILEGDDQSRTSREAVQTSRTRRSE